MNRAVFVSGMLTLMLAASAFGTVTLRLTDTDGLLDATSTVAAPGQSFTVAVNLGVSGETVGGVTMLLQADKSNVLKITGRTIQSATLSDPTSDTAAIANLNPVSTQDVGTTTANVNVGVSSSQALMLLTFQVDPTTQPADYPIKLSFAKARWATTGMDSVSSAIDTSGVVYTVYPGCMGSPPVITSAASIKNHGLGLGELGIALNLAGTATVEPRSGGPTKVVVTYGAPIITLPGFNVSLSGGVLDGAPVVAGSQLTINMMNVPDVSCLSITINGLACSSGGVAPPATLKITARQGDVNADGDTNVQDIIAVRNLSSALPITPGNAKYDFNLSGDINVQDIIGIRNLSSAISSPACTY